MRTIIFRKDNISIAYSDEKFKLGSNFDVWYGYCGTNDIDLGMIVDAKVIKAEMKEDLLAFDHKALYFNDSDDICSVMCSLGRKIFENAQNNGRHHLDQILLEDCYGDKVTICKSNEIITKPYIYDKKLNRVLFLSQNNKRCRWIGHNVSMAYVTYVNGIDLKTLEEEIVEYNSNVLKKDGTIIFSEKDIASGVIFSNYYLKQEWSVFTLTCIEHFQHQLPNNPSNEKCSELHGHSYVCNVTIRLGKKCIVNEMLICEIDYNIRDAMRSALMGECGVTTSENIVFYIGKKIKEKYEVIQIELKETNNIKVIQFYEDM